MIVTRADRMTVSSRVLLFTRRGCMQNVRMSPRIEVRRTVVLLHGLGGDRSFWADSEAVLEQAFHVVAPDLRGSGSAAHLADGHTIADLAADVCAELDRLDVERAHVVGFSMGGLVAQTMAARYPTRVDRLVLASTYAVINTQARMFIDAVREVVVATGTQRLVFDLVCPWLFAPTFLDDPGNAAMFTSPDEDEAPGGWLAQYQAQREFDGRTALSAISAPTLVLAGAEDALVSGRDVADLVDGIGDVTLRTYDGCGHLINIEAPQRFHRDILEFLA